MVSLSYTDNYTDTDTYTRTPFLGHWNKQSIRSPGLDGLFGFHRWKSPQHAWMVRRSLIHGTVSEDRNSAASYRRYWKLHTSNSGRVSEMRFRRLCVFNMYGTWDLKKNYLLEWVPG